jgi:hypothetical protein
MTAISQRHPFLEDLHEEVVLFTSILNLLVQGREQVLKVVKAGAQQYASQTPRFLDQVGRRAFFEYDVALVSGQTARGLVSIQRDDAAKVTELHITFSPLPAVRSLAGAMRRLLHGELDASFFAED